MIKSTYVKNKFSDIIKKRFYFPDGVVSLPFYDPILSEIDKYKQKKILLGREGALVSFRKKGIKNHPRLYLYHQILISVPKNLNISQKDDFTQQIKTLFNRNTTDKILEGGWIMK